MGDGIVIAYILITLICIHFINQCDLFGYINLVCVTIHSYHHKWTEDHAHSIYIKFLLELILLFLSLLTALGVFGSRHTRFWGNDFKYHKNTLLLYTPKMRLYSISLV